MTMYENSDVDKPYLTRFQILMTVSVQMWYFGLWQRVALAMGTSISEEPDISIFIAEVISTLKMEAAGQSQRLVYITKTTGFETRRPQSGNSRWI